MTSRLLHAVAVPSDSQTESGSRQQNRVAKQGVLKTDVPSAESVSAQPGQVSIDGRLAGRFADIHAAMIDELLASSIPVIPYAGKDEQDSVDGYYAPETTSQNPPDPRQGRFQQFDGVLTPKGTRRSHWRAVRTNPQTVDNPFGAAPSPEIGLTTAANKVRWYDDVSGAIETPTVQRTVTGEHGRLNIYDASEPSFDSPALIYDLSLREEFKTDCVLWDDYNREKVYRVESDGDTVGSATVGSATVNDADTLVESQWQRVYLTDHEWQGNIVLESDRLRLVIDQPKDDLRAYRYNADEGQYNLVQLGASDWRLFDVDITSIGLATIEAQLEFEGLTSGATHNLNLSLIRGLEDAVWSVPSNEDSTPQGLIDRLDPIAATTDTVAVPEQDVVKRTEVDR